MCRSPRSFTHHRVAQVLLQLAYDLGAVPLERKERADEHGDERGAEDQLVQSQLRSRAARAAERDDPAQVGVPARRNGALSADFLHCTGGICREKLGRAHDGMSGILRVALVSKPVSAHQKWRVGPTRTPPRKVKMAARLALNSPFSKPSWQMTSPKRFSSAVVTALVASGLLRGAEGSAERGREGERVTVGGFSATVPGCAVGPAMAALCQGGETSSETVGL